MVPPHTESARDQGFLASLKAGTPLRFLVEDAPETSDARLERTIPATLIEKIVTEPDRTVAIAIEISNAIIDGPLNLRHVTFKSGVTLTDCEFIGTVDFSFSTFEHNANFSGSKFTDRALFRAARMKCDLRIDEATFADDSKFTDIHVDEVLSAEGTTFGSVDFHRMEVTKRSSFQPFSKTDQLLPTRFTGDVRFGGANFQGNADFSGTQFEAKADFNGVRIGRNAFFRAIEIEKKTVAPRFAGDADFYGVQIQGDAYFRGAQFEGALNFTLVKIDGTASFRTVVLCDQLFLTRFAGAVDFYGAVVRGNFDFSGAQFANKTNFTSIKIDGETRFCASRLNGNNVPTRFASEANFYHAELKSIADFRGCEFAGRAAFDRCHVGGNALFRSMDLEGTFVITRFMSEARFFAANIEGEADFQAVQFEGRAVFNLSKTGSRALFQSIVLDQRTIQTVFHQEVTFNRVSIQGDAQFNGVHFKGPVFFDGAIIGQGLLCGSDGIDSLGRTEFDDKVRFVRTRIQSDVNFTGAVFKQETNFERVFVGGVAWFGVAWMKGEATATVFLGPVNFYNAEIQGRSDFRGARFKEAKFDLVTFGRGVSFNTVEVNKQIFQTRFEGKVSFYSAAVSGDLDFNGVEFEGDADFTLLKVEGESRFRAIRLANQKIPVRFGGNVIFFNARLQANCYFIGVHVQGSAVFDRLEVAGNAIFRSDQLGNEILHGCFVSEVRFVNAHIDGQADFRGVKFRGDVMFDRTEIDGIACFQRTSFGARLSLRDANFHILLFDDERSVDVKSQNPVVDNSPTETQFVEVDLRGFSYDTMSTDWRKLFATMDPYDRQPFSFLEKNLRTSGNDREADDAYLLRRKQERRWIRERVFNERRFREFPKLLFDEAQWLGFNYGVRPYRLLALGIIIIALGMFMFSQPNAVKVKPATPVPVPQNNQPVTLNKTQAFGFSLRLFSPVEIASGSELVPTQDPAPFLGRLRISYAGYASFHRLAGFVLVPLGVLVLTGLLRRQAKP